MPVGSFLVHATEGEARVGELITAHGSFQTPAFMPVCTQAAAKGLAPSRLREVGVEILLCNAYHLHVRPGEELIRDLGGIHKFMAWDGPILTDSGGYQVFSLSKLRKVSEAGVVFNSHVDGAPIEFTPEKVLKIQEDLGVDIMMVLDECPPFPSEKDALLASLQRTLRWARRCKEAKSKQSALLFGIVQGGIYEDLRQQSIDELINIGFDGYAIGGVSVGESSELIERATRFSAPRLPRDKVRYLMGVGTPADIVMAVSCGVDMFDCVMPTRSARFGRVFVGSGHINIRNSAFRRDPRPLSDKCECYTCRNFSRAYLAHLVHSEEVLAVELLTTHNVYFYQCLMQDIRRAIRAGDFHSFSNDFLMGVSCEQAH
ncbi:MAG: tRNA guanosine(34) transglycosylase Tgt [Deltaproteobacteria bacterium]|nr:tRNA guanosine(34) transglycosylase Tgt [Deltaproteobacteria bacterium]